MIIHKIKLLNGNSSKKGLIEYVISYFKDMNNRYGTFYGEYFENLNDDDDFDMSLSRASHIIKDVYIIEGNLYCDIRLLVTPNGNKLKSNINYVKFKLVEKSDNLFKISAYYALVDIRKEKLNKLHGNLD
jgi:hypothetical protein